MIDTKEKIVSTNKSQKQAQETNKVNNVKPKTCLVRARRKPTDYVLNYSNEGLGLEVWVSPDGLIALGFKGKSVKAAFHYRFGNVGKAQEHIVAMFQFLLLPFF